MSNKETTEQRNLMRINEDYIVLPIDHSIDHDDNENHYFDIQVTKESSVCDQWVFRIKGIYFPEDLDHPDDSETTDSEPTDTTISIDYEVIVPEDYDSENAPQPEVTDVIGECAIDLIENAIERHALELKVEEALSDQ